MAGVDQYGSTTANVLVEEECEGVHSESLVMDGEFAMVDQYSADGHLEFELPPPAHVPDAVSSESSPRLWRVKEGVIQAEDQFIDLLPDLLERHEGEWVYVASDGECQAFPTQDAAEIAAEDAGYSRDRFVVRMVSVLELGDD